MVRWNAIRFGTLAIVLLASTSAFAFSAGDLVLMRGGDANSPQATFGSGEVPAYLDDYSISIVGTTATANLVGSSSIATGTLTLPGLTASSHEGRLNLSTNGQYLDFAGYQQPISAATTRVTDGSGTGSYYRVGQLKYDGTFTSSSIDTSVATPAFMRAAFSNDGTQAWVASKYIQPGPPPGSGAFVKGGLEYISNFGTVSAATVALQGANDYRDLKIAHGQLYGSSGSSSSTFKAIGAIGTGSPTSGSPTSIRISDNNTDSISGFSILTLPGGTKPLDGIGAENVVYGVGDTFLTKSYVDASKTPIVLAELLPATKLTLSFTDAINGPLAEGVLARIDPNNSSWVDLFVQTSEGIYFGIDQSGTASGSIAGTTFSKIIGTAGLALPTGGALYGISAAPVPEPSSIALALCGGLIGLAAAGRKRRQAAQ